MSRRAGRGETGVEVGAWEKDQAWNQIINEPDLDSVRMINSGLLSTFQLSPASAVAQSLMQFTTMGLARNSRVSRHCPRHMSAVTEVGTADRRRSPGAGCNHEHARQVAVQDVRYLKENSQPRTKQPERLWRRRQPAVTQINRLALLHERRYPWGRNEYRDCRRIAAFGQSCPGYQPPGGTACRSGVRKFPQFPARHR